MHCNLDTIEVLPAMRPTVITMEVNDEDVELAFGTSGESLRERLMLALIESLVIDAPYSEGVSA
jgi:hypothetical protein